jgi:hypothetical protein
MWQQRHRTENGKSNDYMKQDAILILGIGVYRPTPSKRLGTSRNLFTLKGGDEKTYMHNWH